MISQLVIDFFIIIAFALAVYAYVLKLKIEKIKRDKFNNEVSDALKKADEQALDTPLNDLVDNSNKEFLSGKRSKRDRK